MKITINKLRATIEQTVALVCLDDQGCQMVSFQTQNPSLGKFLRAVAWKIIFCTFGTFFPGLVKCAKKNWQP
jgi:hypothetical protein